MLFLPLFWIGATALMVPLSIARNIFFIQAAMPCSVVAVAMISIYGGDRRFAVLFGLLTILLSVITIPLYLGLLF